MAYGAIAAAGALYQGYKTNEAMQKQAELQKKNARDALEAAKQNADRQSLMANRVMGSATAGYASSGVELNSGSVLDVLGASAANAELDRLEILHGGDIRATNYSNQASLDQQAGGNALTASYFNALSSVYGGAIKSTARTPVQKTLTPTNPGTVTSTGDIMLDAVNDTTDMMES